jgi:dihydroorotate dehydrogenase
MLAELYPLIRPLLFALDAEQAHHLTLSTLSTLKGNAAILAGAKPRATATRVMGIDFPNPVGLAAGLDKEGAAIDGLAALGFGFVEVGTVTPMAQPGNPRPRMFRIKSANALINRMGFNNGGLQRFLANVARANSHCVLGLNIGKNAATANEQALDDYLTGLRAVYPHASYVTVNISSPNTKGLRDLQAGQALDRLLAALKGEQARLETEHARYVPIALKIAPDLDTADISSIAQRLIAHGLDAVIATNTTTARDKVAGLPHADEAGGLSGAPLTGKATAVIVQLKAELGSRVPIIGVGGILHGQDAADKIRAGAALVQLYTGLIYRGPGLVGECIRAIEQQRSRL